MRSRVVHMVQAMFNDGARGFAEITDALIAHHIYPAW